jgi:cysteine-rich repeat protein
MLRKLPSLRSIRALGAGVLAALASALFAAGAARADCNVVPGTINAYPGAQGSSNTPFASPGDEVVIQVDTTDALRCESGQPQGLPPQSAGLPASEADTLVTVVFTPPNGPARAVLLAAGPSVPPGTISACQAALGAANVAVAPNQAFLLDLGGTRLRFRFPDTDTLIGSAADLRTAAGPAKIAVTSTTEVPPCSALASSGCSAALGTRACVGEIYEVDGTCQTSSEHRDSTFSHFVALPIPNNFQALCTEGLNSPCTENTGVDPELRFTVDAEGNVLWPINWEGVLVGGAVPIPRFVSGTVEVDAIEGGPNVGIRIPSRGFLSAHSLQGHRLPPVFEPIADPNANGAMYGTADSPRGVLRILRRSPTFEECAGGDRAGLPCSEDTDCPGGGSCTAATCRGGANDGELCASDLQCPGGGECGPSLFEFRSRGEVGLASVDTHGLGTLSPAQFELEASNPVPLDGLIETPDLLLEVRSEPTEGEDCDTTPASCDRNGDGDADDVAVATMRSRLTGDSEPIGKNGSVGRAVPRVRELPHTFPAAAAEGDVIAFLEAEQLQGAGEACLATPLPPGCDLNGDGDAGDMLLRAYELESGPFAGDPGAGPEAQVAADPAPLVSGRSLAVSDGLVFFRRSHLAETTYFATALPALAGAVVTSMSDDGRFIAFTSTSSGLVPGDTNAARDVFVYDRDRDGDRIYDEPGSSAVVLVSRSSSGTIGNAASGDSVPALLTGGPVGVAGTAIGDLISRDGRFVAYPSDATNLGPGAAAGTGVYLTDRDADQDGLFDDEGDGVYQIGEIATHEILDPPSGVTNGADVSADGRFVVFDSTSSGSPRVYIYDRETGTSSQHISPFPFSVDQYESLSISDDGRWVATYAVDSLFPSSAFPTLFDRLGPATGFGGVGAAFPKLSGDGRFVSAFSIGAAVYYDRDREADGLFDEDGFPPHTILRSGFPVASAQIEPEGRFFGFGGSDLSGDGRVGILDRLTGMANLFPETGSGPPPLPPPYSPWMFAPRVFTARGGSSALFQLDGAWQLRAPGVDLDDLDTVLSVVDARAQAPEVVALDPAGQVEVAGGNAVFLAPEREDPEGPDLDQDGDTDDQFVRLYRNRQGVSDLGRKASRVAISSSWLAALVDPEELGGPFVAVHPVSGASGWVELGVPADSIAVAGGWVAFLVPEARFGVNLNDDADPVPDDRVLHLYDAAAGGPVVNTGLAAEEFVLSERLVALRVPEGAQGVALPGLNGDGDLLDSVLHVIDLDLVEGSSAEGALLNTGQAGLACPFEACDGRFPYRIAGGTVTFLTREEDQSGPLTAPGCDEIDPPVGAGDCDLNGDGDAVDVVLQHFNAVEEELLASAGSGRSQFAASPAGVCTDTGQACVGDVDCPNGTCFVPPGLCLDDLGTSCDVADPASCPLGQICWDTGLPTGTCQAVVGPCHRANSTCAPGAICRELEHDTRRLKAPTTEASDGRQGLVSGGVCIEALATSCNEDSDCGVDEFCNCGGDPSCAGGTCARQTEPCRTAADCPDGASCVQDLVLVGDSDADQDDVAASIDNCPKHPNTDQSDIDADEVGDRCDLQTCGDGSQQFAEGCDDGNAFAGDGCDPGCQLEAGFETACSNGLDDDGDGLVDFAEDGGCDGTGDSSERRDASDLGSARACDDGKDNDGDQLVDWPTDPGCLSPDSLLENPACSNGIDDDGDGVVDAIDGGCGDGSDRSEGPDCSDGIDNDGDGQTDHPADVHCASPAGASEAPLCSNGLDDDGDGALDFPADPGCASALDDDEHSPALACDDGFDGDGDGTTDFPDDPGCASLSDPSETDPALVCDNGLDDDTDGATDFPADPGCASWTDGDEQLSTAPCDDGLDHDGDALVDTDDPDCSGPDDPTEFHLSAGDVLVTVDAGSGTGKIVRLHPVSGAQTLVWESAEFRPNELTIDSNGDLYFSDGSLEAVVRVNLEAGTHEVVSLGGHLDAPIAIDAEPRGTLVLTDQTGDRVLRIDPRTGAQQILYAGLPLQAPSGISVEANGNIIVSDTTVDALFRLNPTTGSITTLVAPASWNAPRHIDVEPEGNILVVDQAPTDEIYRVSPTGTLTVLSSGAPYNDTRGVARSGGTIFVTDIGAQAVFRFPNFGGTATALSSGGFFGAPRGIEVVPATQCSDIVDNDGDGLINLDDPDCSGPLDRTEFNLAAGDLVVANLGNLGSIDGSIVRVKPSGGAQTLLSADPRFEALEGIRFDAQGRILATDAVEDAVFRFDPVSGHLETLARGGTLDGLSGIVVEAGGAALVSSADAIARVQLETGLAALATGPVFLDPNGIEIEGAGTWLVADGAADTIERVDPVTGVPTVLADAADGLDHPFYLEIEPGTGNVLIAERDDLEISRLTVASGTVTLVASTPCGSGIAPRDVALDASGDAIVTCDRLTGTLGDKIVRIDLPGSTVTTISSEGLLERAIGLAIVKPACADGFDNDGDGGGDFPADPGCASAADTTETNPAVACDDGLDNDLDLFVDFPADPGCASPTGTTEDADCSDGQDNDGDGLTDHPADAGCANAADDSETNAAAACDDGVDNDGDGLADHPADPGCASPSDASEQNAASVCDDGLDNDGDGQTDFPDDLGCGAATDSSERQPGGPACDDGLDNDGDGLADEPADPGCTGPTDPSEKAPGLACDDGLDNDSDGFVDDPADPGCWDPLSTKENPACQDGLDNDGQIGTDFDGGVSVNGPPGDPNGADPQCAGKPWKDAEKSGCGIGFELAPILALLARRRRRYAPAA